MSVTEIDARGSRQTARGPHSRQTVTPYTGCTGARRGGRPTNINIIKTTWKKDIGVKQKSINIID